MPHVGHRAVGGGVVFALIDGAGGNGGKPLLVPS